MARCVICSLVALCICLTVSKAFAYSKLLQGGQDPYRLQDMDPCSFVMQGRHFWQGYPNLSDLPLSLDMLLDFLI